MLAESYSIKHQVKLGTELLKKTSDSAKLDAQVLLGFVLNKAINYLYTWPEKSLTLEQHKRYHLLVKERLSGKPIAYITGVKEFWSLPFYCNNATLIPRPETEILIEHILIEAEKNLAENCSCIDLGTGTGAIALALASEKPRWTIEAIDFSEEAVTLAQKNAKNLGLEQVNIYQSDWFNNVETGKTFDVIISNPPYIDSSDIHLSQGDVRFEPLSALVAEDKGLADIVFIASSTKGFLKNGGYLFFEHGYNQGQAVNNILQAQGFTKVTTIKDFVGNDRVTYGVSNQTV